MIERNNDKKEMYKTKVLRNSFISIAIGLFLLLLIIVYMNATDRIVEEYMTKEISEYGNWDGHMDLERESLESGLFLFPQEIAPAEDAEYLYYCASDMHSIHQYGIYTAVTYTEQKFEEEVKRIADTRCQVQVSLQGETVTNSVMYSENLFKYPAYVAIYNSNLSYEYALLDTANNKIIYVYLQLKDGNEIIPEEYLPIEAVGTDMYVNNSWENQNLYYSKDKNGDYCYYKHEYEE